MFSGLKIKDWLVEKVCNFLTKEREVLNTPLSDFARFRFEIRSCDVILVEGRSYVSSVIRTITLSQWTHSALYIGRLNDIRNQEIRDLVRSYYVGDPNEPLIIEALLGRGATISQLSKYQYDNLRICRPKDLTPEDAEKVIGSAVRYLGTKYHVRQLLDLARLMFPFGILPRRWRSTLFEHNTGDATRTICSTMLAEAFATVRYPILPIIQRNKEDKLQWFRRNSNLFTPRDFDYSPYFDIIKFPFFGDDISVYKKLPWDKTGVICNDENECYLSEDRFKKEMVKI